MPSKKPKQWTGYYYVNLKEEGHRSWEDCVRYGFISAGGGKWYRDRIRSLKPGFKILVYMKNRGYIGYGIVREEACMVKEFKLDNGQYLLNQNLKEPNLAHDLHDPEKCEWAVKVDWIKTLDKDNAIQRKGKHLFYYKGIWCHLYDFDTYHYLKPVFNLK